MTKANARISRTPRANSKAMTSETPPRKRRKQSLTNLNLKKTRMRKMLKAQTDNLLNAILTLKEMAYFSIRRA